MTGSELETDGRIERGDRTREALLRGAKQAFAERGFKGASVRAIAEAAGAHPALVRYHFGSKRGLYEHVIDEAMGGLRARMLEAALGARSLADGAKRIVSAYLDYLAEDRAFPLLVVRGLLEGDRAVRRVATHHLRPGFRALAQAIGAAPEEADELRELALTLFGAAVTPFVYAPLAREVLGRSPLTREAVEARRAHLHRLVDRVLAPQGRRRS